MLSIRPIRAFDDNCIWLLVNDACREAFVVEPGDAQPMLQGQLNGESPLDVFATVRVWKDHYWKMPTKAGAALLKTYNSSSRSLSDLG